MILSDTVRDLIATGPFAHVTTLNPDGSLQVSVAWSGLDGDELVMGHVAEQQKVKNVRRDPRMVIPFLGTETRNGLREYAVVDGLGSITEGGATDLPQPAGVPQAAGVPHAYEAGARHRHRAVDHVVGGPALGSDPVAVTTREAG